MIYFIDTNIFLRSLYKENPQTYLDCITFLAAVKNNRLYAYTGTIVLTEIAYTLKSYYKFKKERIIIALQSIFNLSGLKIIDNYNQNLALEFFSKYSVKYTDALIASNEEIYVRKTTVISYDRDFDKLKIVRKEPGEIIKSLHN